MCKIWPGGAGQKFIGCVKFGQEKTPIGNGFFYWPANLDLCIGWTFLRLRQQKDTSDEKSM
jgi:hypothetical protein